MLAGLRRSAARATDSVSMPQAQFKDLRRGPYVVDHAVDGEADPLDVLLDHEHAHALAGNQAPAQAQGATPRG
jgi:hypothetical protein